MPRTTDPEERTARSPAALFGIVLAGLAALAALLALGTWQLQRRVRKLGLVDQVQRRVHAAPVAPPAPGQWRQVTAAQDGYRHVQVGGLYAPGSEVLVQAVTRLGGGYWVMTPLRTDPGYVVLINRGFIPGDHSASADHRPPSGHVTVTGLLRLTEPKGGFLRANAPARNRWYSRDVTAISAARGLSPAAPYFIDADDAPNPGGWPVGGLTVIQFPNSHLIYALTWYGLALLVAGGLARILRDAWRARTPQGRKAITPAPRAIPGGDHARP